MELEREKTRAMVMIGGEGEGERNGEILASTALDRAVEIDRDKLFRSQDFSFLVQGWCISVLG